MIPSSEVQLFRWSMGGEESWINSGWDFARQVWWGLGRDGDEQDEGVSKSEIY